VRRPSFFFRHACELLDLFFNASHFFLGGHPAEIQAWISDRAHRLEPGKSSGLGINPALCFRSKVRRDISSNAASVLRRQTKDSSILLFRSGEGGIDCRFPSIEGLN
jgi:hypothetical protein